MRPSRVCIQLPSEVGTPSKALKTFYLDRQGQNLALTVLCVPYSLDVWDALLKDVDGTLQDVTRPACPPRKRKVDSCPETRRKSAV